MGRTEVIKALNNLGGQASLFDLELEYYKLVYPPENYGNQYYINKVMQGYSDLHKYLKPLMAYNQITKHTETITEEEYNKEYEFRKKVYGVTNRYGMKKKKIIYTLLQMEIELKN